MISRAAPLLYLVLLTLAVPWYWPEDNHAIWFGVPGWVVVAIVVSALASVLTAYLLSTQWTDGESQADE
jgi:hypothetical protein